MVGNLEGKMDLLIEASSSHDKRIRKLEGYKKYLMGAVAVCSIGISYLVEWIKGK
jgi:hypothetical protein